MAGGFNVAGFRFANYGNPGPIQVAKGGATQQERLGWADIEEAKSQKASNYQIWQLYDRAVREQKEQQVQWGSGGKDGVKFALHINPIEQMITDTYGSRVSAPGGHKFWQHDPGSDVYGMGMGSLNTQGTLDEKIALRDFAVKHGLSIGAGVNEHIQSAQEQKSADERDARHLAQQQQLADEQEARDAAAAEATAAYRADLLAQQEAQNFQASRVKGSNPTGVGGAASIRGSRLSITETGGRKGTKRFARPTQFMNTLGVNASGAGSAGKSPITP